MTQATKPPGGFSGTRENLTTQPATLKNAVVYLRVSTARQATKGGEVEGYSIPAQREACIRKAKDLGAVVVKEFVDAGASARSADRNGLQELLRRVREADIDYVIVHKLDRLARSRPDDVAIMLELERAGATLVSTTEQIDDTPSGNLLHGIMAAISEHYSKNLSSEAKKGMQQKVLRGGTPGYAPIGYLNVTKRFEEGREGKSVVLDPERAPALKWAFEEYATGKWSIKDIAAALEERGLRSRETRKMPSKPLNQSQVHRIFQNVYYIGKLPYKGMVYDGAHEPLIDMKTWHKVQDVLSDRRIAGDRSWIRTHYLKGTIYCDRCESRMGYGPSRGKGGIYYYFFCLGRHTGRNNCDLPYLRVDDVEKLIEENVWRWANIEAKDIDVAEKGALERLRKNEVSGEQLVVEQQRRIVRLERQKQKLFDAYMEEAMPVEDLKVRQAKLAVELNEAQRLIEGASQYVGDVQRNLSVIAAIAKFGYQLYQMADVTARKSLNQAVFEKIFINSHDLDNTSVPEIDRAQPTEVVDAFLSAAQEIYAMDSAENRPVGAHVATGATTARTAASKPGKTAHGAGRAGHMPLRLGESKTLGLLSLTKGFNVLHLAERARFELAVPLLTRRFSRPFP